MTGGVRLSANTDDLGRFVAVADRRSVELAALLERLRSSRAAALSTGLAPADIVVRDSTDSLLVGIRETDRFVAGVRESLLTGAPLGSLPDLPLPVWVPDTLVKLALDPLLDSWFDGALGLLFGSRAGRSDREAGEAFESITDLIDSGDDLAISEGELNRIQGHLVGLDDDDLHDVLAWLSDEQLERLFHNVHSSGFWSNDWNDGQRQAFYQNLMRAGATGDAALWHRLGLFSPHIDPDPQLGLSDTARAEANQQRRDWWDGLAYAELLLPLGGDATHPIDYTQVRQGSIGDCYLISAMIALAKQDPTFISDIVTENPNGTYTVAFGDGTVEVVNAQSVYDANGDPAFARNLDGTAWSTIIEKAYAQKFGGFGSDPGISGGMTNRAIEALTGREGTFIRSGDLDFDDLADRFERGELLGLNTIDRPDELSSKEWLALDTTPDVFKGPDTFQKLHQNHAFVVVDVDRAAGTVSVINPWDPSKPPFEMTFEAMQEAVNGVEVNTAP